MWRELIIFLIGFFLILYLCFVFNYYLVRYIDRNLIRVNPTNGLILIVIWAALFFPNLNKRNWDVFLGEYSLFLSGYWLTSLLLKYLDEPFDAKIKWGYVFGFTAYVLSSTTCK